MQLEDGLFWDERKEKLTTLVARALPRELWAPMTDLDVLTFVVWGGGLFNVGFLAGWFAGRRRLPQSDDEPKRDALQGRDTVSALRVAQSGCPSSLRGKPAPTEGEEAPAFAHPSTQKSAVREVA
jgi:hypothetical protein